VVEVEDTRTSLTPIRTHCPSCDNGGITVWDSSTPGFTLDQYVAGLKSHCPECGGSGRTITVLAEPPDPTLDPEGAGLWADMQEWLTDGSSPRRAGPRVGRNDPCPCGSGKKHKHCCGR
jgi:hypothetical protein